jgi:F-type H+-transporting ATPase subunit alpha
MFNSDKFTSLLKAKIASYEKDVNFTEEGKVISINDGVAIASGLENAMLNEIVKFENGTCGIILNLETSSVGIILLGEYTGIRENSSVKRTKTVVSIPAGDGLLGRVIDPLGNPLDDKPIIRSKTLVPIEKIAPGVMTREPVDLPLETGILIIDAMFPLGKGQRELIIGDRQTGKTTIAIDAILNQRGKNVKCVYVSIGQKNSSLAKIITNLEINGAMKYTTIVVASASDLSGIAYIAPYSGMAIAEEWAKNGDDVLIVFDDLTKHAISYRTMSLLLHRPSGREAYPGDIFYLHSRLLERACKLSKKYGGGTITALPIVETQNGDISSYIPTNIISITDGQFFLQTNLFNIGQRPAIDVGLSVSRIGSTAQYQPIKQLSKSIKIILSEYYEAAAFSQFGSELDEATIDIINIGKRIVELIKQNNASPYDWKKQLIILFLIYTKLIQYINLENVVEFKVKFLAFIETSKIYKKIDKDKKLTDSELEELHDLCLNFIKKYNVGTKLDEDLQNRFDLEFKKGGKK